MSDLRRAMSDLRRAVMEFWMVLGDMFHEAAHRCYRRAADYDERRLEEA